MWRACGRLRLAGVTRRGELGLRAHVVSAALARASARRRLHAPRLRRALPVRVRPAWHLEHVAGTGWAVSAGDVCVRERAAPAGWAASHGRRARCRAALGARCRCACGQPALGACRRHRLDGLRQPRPAMFAFVSVRHRPGGRSRHGRRARCPRRALDVSDNTPMGGLRAVASVTTTPAQTFETWAHGCWRAGLDMRREVGAAFAALGLGIFL